jgi:hypothetical protein
LTSVPSARTRPRRCRAATTPSEHPAPSACSPPAAGAGPCRQPGRDGPGSDTQSTPRATGPSPTAQLVRQAARTPTRVLTPQLTDRRLNLDGGLVGTELGAMGAVRQAAQALVPIAGQPAVQGLARHPDLGGHLDYGPAGQHGQHRPIGLLDNGQLDKHRSRPPATRRPKTTNSQQADHGHCQPSTETDVSCINRSRTGRVSSALPNLALGDQGRRLTPAPAAVATAAPIAVCVGGSRRNVAQGLRVDLRADRHP